MSFLTPDEFDEYLRKRTMAGTAGRSGRPSSSKTYHAGDGSPESPRKLSELAQKHFNWLTSLLDTGSEASPWRRIDGATLASLAELLSDQEAIATELALNPANDRLLRLRVQIADRIFKFSALVGMTPRDRQRLPGPQEVAEQSEWD